MDAGSEHSGMIAAASGSSMMAGRGRRDNQKRGSHLGLRTIDNSSTTENIYSTLKQSLKADNG